MFESVAPETYFPRSRKALYESLPLSIAAHAAVAAAIVLAGSWNVAFPTHTPPLTIPYSLEPAVPLPPPPPPPPAPLVKATAPQTVPVGRIEEVAPTIIPDTIPIVLPQPVSQVELPIVDAPVVSSTPQGVEGGLAGGVLGATAEGEPGGEVGGVVGSVVPPNTVIVKRDAPLPTAPMSMTFPQYPREAKQQYWEDQVVVRYIIGRDGRVRDVTVIHKPQREIFTAATVKAIRGWRFKPHRVNGVPQEIVHELAVNFEIQ